MSDIRMYCTAFCPYCVRAEALLKSKDVAVNRIFIDSKPEGFRKLYALTGRHTVPQIFIGERHVGGYDDLAALESQGQLDPLLLAPGL